MVDQGDQTPIGGVTSQTSNDGDPPYKIKINNRTRTERDPREPGYIRSSLNAGDTKDSAGRRINQDIDATLLQDWPEYFMYSDHSKIYPMN
jgi:hypothetical protein